MQNSEANVEISKIKLNKVQFNFTSLCSYIADIVILFLLQGKKKCCRSVIFWQMQEMARIKHH